jgi:hypothetical protein
VSVDMAELQNSNQVMSAPLVLPWRLETEIFRVAFTEAMTAQASPKRDFAVRWAAPVVCMSVRCVSEGGGSATLRADSDDHFVLTTPKPRIGLIAGRLDIYGAFSDQVRYRPSTTRPVADILQLTPTLTYACPSVALAAKGARPDCVQFLPSCRSVALLVRGFASKPRLK